MTSFLIFCFSGNICPKQHKFTTDSVNNHLVYLVWHIFFLGDGVFSIGDGIFGVSDGIFGIHRIWSFWKSAWKLRFVSAKVTNMRLLIIEIIISCAELYSI